MIGTIRIPSSSGFVSVSLFSSATARMSSEEKKPVTEEHVAAPCRRTVSLPVHKVLSAAIHLMLLQGMRAGFVVLS